MSETATPPRRALAAFLVGPASATVVLVLVLPLLLLCRYSVNRFVPGQFMVRGADDSRTTSKFFADPYYSRVHARHDHVAVSSTVFCLILGYPTAYLLARSKSTTNADDHAVVSRSSSAMRCAPPADRRLRPSGLFPQSPPSLARHHRRAARDHVYDDRRRRRHHRPSTWPFMVLTLQSVIEGIPEALDEAASAWAPVPCAPFAASPCRCRCPASPRHDLCFILAMNAYATPVLPRRAAFFQMMAPLVYDQISSIELAARQCPRLHLDGGDAASDARLEPHAAPARAPLKGVA